MANSTSNAALDEFFAECDEIIQRVSLGLQSLEKGGVDRSTIDSIYRDMHTMKGSAQLFGMKTIGQLAHVMEACLDPIRKSDAQVEPSFADAALRTLDLIDRITKGLRTGKSESEFENEVREQLPLLADEAAALFGADFRLMRDALVDQSGAPGDKVMSTVVESAPPAPAPAVEPAPKAPVVTKPLEIVNSEKQMSTTPSVPESGEEFSHYQQQHPEPKAGDSKSQPVDTTIRVQVELLDRLMNLVGELVLVRNQVTQYSSRHDDLEYINMAQSLSVVTTELQNEVMLTRMQPIGVVVNKFQRVVRDLARDLGKKIDLTLQGAETELDKTLLEAIKDPLTHIVRNACDHGIETPTDRKAAGKPESGHLMIRAFHDGGQVFIEVSDDGKGIDRERVVQKAVERKILTAERASKMSDREVCQIIFLPGFSTAQQVTNVSGRGVGMDVVKTNIEKIGGSVEVVSTFKKGSTVRLKIPLTLAIVPALLVRSARDRFAIPQVKLVELVRTDPSENRDRIELLQGRPMYRLRGDLLPIVLLDEALKRGGGAEAFDLQKVNSSIANIVVLNAEGEMFGLLVDEILDTADIVVKPLGSVLKKVSLFSGSTILGDGSVALILDVMGLAEGARINTKSQRRSDDFMDSRKKNEKDNHDSQELLLVRLNAEAVHAIPLCLVQRLEEFPGSSVEVSGSQQVVRYRDSILPIIHLNSVLGYRSATTEQDRISVVVVQRAGRRYGIAVDEVLDVVTTDRAVDEGVRDRAGIMGNVLLREEIVVVVDVLEAIESEFGRLSSGPGADPSTRAIVEKMRQTVDEQRAKKTRILFAEDVPFFRKQVSKVLTHAGFEVQIAEDGAEALKILEASTDGDFALLLSDIEMPNKTGLELAREVRAMKRFDNLPLIALTTRFRDKDVEDGKKAGFDAYLEKLNADVLLSTIRSLTRSVEAVMKTGS